MKKKDAETIANEKKVRAWEEAMQAEAVPDGWTVTYGARNWDNGKGFVLKASGVSLTAYGSEWGIEVDGELDGGYLGRIGVDGWQQFSLDEPPTVAKIVALIAEKRAARAAFDAVAITLKIGNSSRRVTPERLEKIKADLAAGKIVDFRPSGFGTGYRIGTKLRVERYSGGQVTDAETLRILGVKRLVFQTFDCD